jgi:hypothetical protein
VTVTILLAAAAAVGGAWWGDRTADERAAAAEESVHSSTPTVTSDPSPTPVQTTPAPEPVVLPDTCSALYSDEMLGVIHAIDGGELELNRTDFTFQSLHRGPRLNDEFLSAVLWNVDRMQCDWDPPPTETFVGTTVALLSTSTGEVLSTALPRSGFECSAHREGTLCRTSITYEESGMTIVDEVFTRDGIVVATGYLNIDVPGYLDDIIDSLWGEQ